jgi:hypothetical protein
LLAKSSYLEAEMPTQHPENALLAPLWNKHYMWSLQPYLVWLRLWHAFIVNLLSLGGDLRFTPTVVAVKPR